VVVPTGKHDWLSNPAEEARTFIELCLSTPTHKVWVDPHFTPGCIRTT
jgi:hypothetical protein